MSIRRLAQARLPLVLIFAMSVCPMMWQGVAGGHARDESRSCCPMDGETCPESQPSQVPAPMRGCQGCPDPGRNGAPAESSSCRTCQAALPRENALRIAEPAPAQTKATGSPLAVASAAPMERRASERRLEVRGTSPPVHLLAVVFRN